MIANYGLDAEDVQKQVSSLITGETAGKVFEGDRKFDIVVRMDQNSVTDLEKLYQIPVSLADGSSILLSELIELKMFKDQTRFLAKMVNVVSSLQQMFVELILVVTFQKHNLS